MRLLTRGRSGPKRKGVILLVVLAMLTLFALVGISFVLVAEAQATSARIAREAESAFRPEIDPEAAFALFLSQLLYDVPDDNIGIFSAMRGQSLARNMYGWNPGPAIDPATLKPQPFQSLNDKPYSGTGRLHAATPFQNGVASTDAALMNFQYLKNPSDPNDPDFLRHPERPGFQAAGAFNLSNPTAGQKPYAGGFNVPYTYPDHNNFYLAEIDPTTGQVIVPSFHREYLFGKLDLPAGGNPNWTNPEGKYLTLRPRRFDNLGVPTQPGGQPDPATNQATVGQQNPNIGPFPMPLDGGTVINGVRNGGGDVKNLDNAPGGADSIWIDIGAPVMTAADGRKYKMLVAPLILALDGRIDLNVVGNLMGSTNGLRDHRSNQGWGVWEVNPAKVLDGDAPTLVEWKNLFNGSAKNPLTNLRHIRGRYDRGLDPLPGPPPVPNLPQPVGAAIAAAVPPANGSPRFYAQVDYDSQQNNSGSTSEPIEMPAAGGPSAYTAFPGFPGPNGITGKTYGNYSANEDKNHASIYWALRPRDPNRRFPIESAAQLLRAGGTGSDMLGAELSVLLKNNLVGSGPSDQNALRRRNLITFLSADLDRPGVTPYVWDFNDPTTQYQLQQQPAPDLSYRPQMPPIPFPALGTPMIPKQVSEFDAATWRSNLASLLRVNLYRPLTDYPKPNVNTGQMPTGPIYQQATADRVGLATDLFTALRRATGAMEPQAAYDLNNGGVANRQFTDLRYLAQLAVNIVDYIDNDDISTRFDWSATAGVVDKANKKVNEFVYGVELPRLVINETYVQYDNDPASQLVPINPKGKRMKLAPGQNYNVNVWVELYNPMLDDQNLSKYTDTTARLSAYQILLAKPNLNGANGVMRRRANVTGDPNFRVVAPANNVFSTMNTWGPGPNQDRVLPGGGVFGTVPVNNVGSNVGFYVIGPAPPPKPAAQFLAGADPQLPTTFTSPQMKYTIPADNAVNSDSHTTVILQRLANPYIAFNANTNPWITVDFVENPQSHVMDGRMYTTTNQRNPRAMNTRTSFGRPQPYAALLAQSQAQKPATPMSPNQPQTTFFCQNTTAVDMTKKDPADATRVDPTQFNKLKAGGDTTLKIPFDWLTHLDRYPTNPLELLHVTDARPHDLTQRFITGNNINATPYDQTQKWTDTSTRLHRFFELVTTGTRGTRDPNQPATVTLPGVGGRVVGKVNINLANHQTVFQALADAQSGNGFTDANAVTAYQNFITQRGLLAAGSPLAPTDQTIANLSGQPNTHKPLWSLGVGQAIADAAATAPPPDPFLRTFSKTRGIENSLLQGVFDLPDPPAPNPPAPNPPLHPYQKKELLRKIYGSVTTRSNVFAVWATVGFFEVDTNFSPPKLGAEIGAAENRQIRHRMFSIVDRTQLQAWPTGTVIFPTKDAQGNATTAIAPGPNVTIQLQDTRNATAFPTTGASVTHPNAMTPIGGTAYAWTLQEGAILVYEPNTDNEETVVAHGPVGGPFTATFTKSHNPGCNVIVRGNPGPLQRYDPRQDRDVVPYFALID